MFMCLKPNVFLLDTVGLERGYQGNVVHGVMGLDWPKHTYTVQCVYTCIFFKVLFCSQISIKPNYKGTPADLLDKQREDHPLGQTAM